MVGLAAFVLVGTLLGWSWALEQEEKRLTQTVVARTQQLITLKAMLRRATGLREDLADLTARVRSLQALMHRRGTTLQILDALLDSIPHGLWITALEGRGRQLRAHGAALSGGAVADLMSSLRASGRFDDVDIVVARQDLGEALDAPAPLLFEITCRFGH
ncbi:MAG: PilN domain-containing protein [Candidatus Rokuibacteriota bacterium]